VSNSLRERALRLLARREHSRAEMLRKLGEEGNEDELAALLTRFEECGLLSDARFAEQFVSSRSGRFGTRRLQYDMKLRGVSEDHASAALASLQQNEVVRARDVWARKFDSVPDDAKSWARQARFLQSRGFSADSIHKVLREKPEQDE
jgi:regulatory protein